MRNARFAGTFYEKAESLLSKQIEECFLGEKGPGITPTIGTEKIQAAIIPHAGYIYSGQCAAWAYKALAEGGLPDLFIIIGPSHHYKESGFSMETFETPFGFVRVKQDFARNLAEKGHLKQNETIHLTEHCIEVQLPFLQYTFKQQIDKIKILPILISEDADLKNIALDIKETLMEMNLRAVFIVSSDFTHYGPNYHYVPFSENVKQNIYDLDGQAIELIKNQDQKLFLEYVDKNFSNICGVLPIVLLMNLVKSEKILLEQYYISGDLLDNYRNSVSYASLIFK
jgi:MEMO1 family protein